MLVSSTQKGTPIYQDRDFYVPAFQIKVGERPLDRETVLDILSVRYKDSLDEIDSCEITINNWDADKRTFKYVDSTKFDPGQKLELWMGYYNDTHRMLTGEITSLRPSFPAGGQPTLVISALNLLHRLRRKQESHVYLNKTDTQIAKQVGTRLNLKVETDANAAANETPYPYILQNNQYDILFLMQRARIAGYDLFVKEQDAQGNPLDNTIYFGPTQDIQRVSYELVYGLSLNDFQPNLTTAHQVSKVTVRGWAADQKKPIEVTVTRDQLGRPDVGSANGQGGVSQAFSEQEEVMATHVIANEAEAKQLARQTLERIAQDMIKGSGTVVGLPDLRAGSVVFLSGLGARFSGRYFVTSTGHAIGDSGYVTSFECRKEEKA